MIDRISLTHRNLCFTQAKPPFLKFHFNTSFNIEAKHLQNLSHAHDVSNSRSVFSQAKHSFSIIKWCSASTKLKFQDSQKTSVPGNVCLAKAKLCFSHKLIRLTALPAAQEWPQTPSLYEIHTFRHSWQHKCKLEGIIGFITGSPGVFMFQTWGRGGRTPAFSFSRQQMRSTLLILARGNSIRC